MVAVYQSRRPRVESMELKGAPLVASILSTCISVFITVAFIAHLFRLRSSECTCATVTYKFRVMFSLVVVTSVLSLLIPFWQAPVPFPIMLSLFMGSVAASIAGISWYIHIRKSRCECARSWANALWLADKIASLSLLALAAIATAIMIMIARVT